MSIGNASAFVRGIVSYMEPRNTAIHPSGQVVRAPVVSSKYLVSAALTDGLTNIELRLLEALGATARGPKRNGTFALWLVVRYCDGVLPPDALTPRIARKRFEQLQRRLTSLSLPAPLRRGVNGALRELRDERPDGIALALHQLVAPSNETLGDGAADALNRASRLAREITLQGEVTG